VNSTAQIVAVIISAALLLLVLELVRRRRLTEEYSFIWIVFALGLLVLSLWRESLHAVAHWLDIYYPPAVLLGALMFFVFIASLYFSVVVSRQRQQLERLVEDLAILDAQQRDHASTSPGRLDGARTASSGRPAGRSNASGTEAWPTTPLMAPVPGAGRGSEG